MSDDGMNTNLDEHDDLPAMLAQPMSLAVGIARAEIDQQITTARAYPRSIKQVTDRIFSLATLDKESAEESMYALPRGGKPITGPSIRFAEVVKQAYGNCRAAARVVHVDRDEKFVEAEGVFHDLETNVATTARVRRRIVDSRGRLYSDDMIIVTGNAAASIALRNAIMGGVPKPLWRRAYEAVQQTIAGDITTLVENRGNAIKAFAVYGVKPDQIFAALGVAGVEDVTVEHIPVLRGMFGTLKNGEATVEEMFGSMTAPGTAAQPLTSSFTDKGGLKGGKKAETAPPAAQEQAQGSKTASAATPGPATPAAAQEAEIPHNPETGEVEEGPGQPQPDEMHYLDTVPAGKTGARQAFKNGKAHSMLPNKKPGAHKSYPLTEEELAQLFPGEPKNERSGAAIIEGQAQAEPEVEADPEPEAVDAEAQEGEPDEIQADADAAEHEALIKDASGGDDFPPEMSAYIDAVEEVPDWIAVKAAMKTFYTSDYFKSLSTAQQNKIRGETWATCIDRQLPGLPDQAADVSAFRLWLEWISGEDAADAILGTLRALEQDAEFAGKDDTFKAAIRKAAADRMTALGD